MKKVAVSLAVLGLVLAFVFLVSVFAEALRLSDNRLIFRIDRNPTQEVTVTNTSDEPIGMRVYPEMADGQRKENYLGEWLTIYPPRFNLGPGEQRTVRFSVRPPQDVRDGEYRSMLYFHRVPPGEDGKEGFGANEDVKAGVQFMVKKGINIYGRYGNLDFEGKLKGLQFSRSGANKMQAEAKFVNRGNVHLRMSAQLKLDCPEGTTVLKNEKRFVVHRNDSRSLGASFELSRKEEEYLLSLDFIGRSEDEKIHGEVIYSRRKFLVPAKI